MIIFNSKGIKFLPPRKILYTIILVLIFLLGLRSCVSAETLEVHWSRIIEKTSGTATNESTFSPYNSNVPWQGGSVSASSSATNMLEYANTFTFGSVPVTLPKNSTITFVQTAVLTDKRVSQPFVFTGSILTIGNDNFSCEVNPIISDYQEYEVKGDLPSNVGISITLVSTCSISKEMKIASYQINSISFFGYTQRYSGDVNAYRNYCKAITNIDARDYSTNVSTITTNTTNISTGITSLSDLFSSDSQVEMSEVQTTINNLTSFIPNPPTIVSVMSMPIALMTSFSNGFNTACQSFHLGSLLGYELVFPCIDLSSIFGNVWNIIDVIISGFIIYAISLKLYKIYNDMISFNSTTSDITGGVK